MVNWGRLRQCEPTESGFKGPPNFVLDVFTAGELAEYERRRKLFERFGVTEYVAVEDTQAPTLHWNRLEDGKFRIVDEDAPGLIQSKAMPGLWIPLEALARRDWWEILSTIERGVSRRGHHEFMETIWHKDVRAGHDEDVPFDAA